jgi:hypothetical protein
MPLLEASLAAALFLGSLQPASPSPAAAGLVGLPVTGTCYIHCSPAGGTWSGSATLAACCSGEVPNPCPAGTSPLPLSWIGGNPLRIQSCAAE